MTTAYTTAVSILMFTMTLSSSSVIPMGSSRHPMRARSVTAVSSAGNDGADHMELVLDEGNTRITSGDDGAVRVQMWTDRLEFELDLHPTGRHVMVQEGGGGGGGSEAKLHSEKHLGIVALAGEAAVYRRSKEQLLGRGKAAVAMDAGEKRETVGC